jgi:Ferric reductase like transmembrane component
VSAAAVAFAAATPRAVWYLSRGAGAVALLGLTATVVLGVVDVRRVSAPRWPRFLLDGVHRDLSLVSLAVIVVHVATAVIDSFAPIALADAVLPFASAYRPLWLGLGALAFDLLLALTLTSLLRRRLGYRAWRAVHWAAYACWPLALVHGLGTGSDVRAAWLTALTLVCVAAVLAAVAWRVSTGATRRRAPILAGVAAACLALAAWAQQGPLHSGWARRAGTPLALLPHTALAAAPSATATATPAALPRRFTATLTGTVDQRRSADGSRATVDLALTLAGGASGALDLHLSGPAVAGGVRLRSSRVTLGPAGSPQLYQGEITQLAGQRVAAVVQRADGRELRLEIRLAIAGGSVTGALAAEPA